MAPPRIQGIVETSLYVAALDRSCRFYAEVIGLETLARDGRMATLAVAPNQVLLLFRRGGSVEPSPTPEGVTGSGFIPAHDAAGAQHLCFAIPPKALESWRERLEANGIAIESRLTWPAGGTSLYFRDPDGHSLELAVPGLWANF